MSLLPDWLTGYDAENAQRAADADKKLREINAQTYTPGTDAFNTSRRQYETQTPFGPDAQRDEIDAAFKEKLDEQAKKLIGGPLAFLGETIKSILGAFPVWVWLTVGVVVFFYLGGASLVRKQLAK